MDQIEIRKVAEDEDVASTILYRDYSTFVRKNYITVGEDKMCIAESFEKYVDSIRNLEVYQSDVFITSFPKSGTTWLSEMVWILCNNFDYEKAKEVLQKRVPFLEISGIYDQEEMVKILKQKGPEFISDSVGFIQRLREPRLIKTHLPFSLLPEQIQNQKKQPKMLYIMRNPKDVCVSYYHHAKLLEGYRGNLEDFCTLFLNEKAPYTPYWKNLMGYWQRRNYSNILILQYEELKSNLPSAIKKVASFLDKTISEEQTETLTKHLSFSSMKENEAVNGEKVINLRKQLNLVEEDGYLMRSGETDQYQNEMSQEMIQKFNVWIKENISCTDFVFYNSE